MDHIRQFDWYSSQPDSRTFVTESELDNCVTERILHNKYYDPLISSESEDEATRPKFDWDKIFKKKKNDDKVNRMYTAGLRSLPPYPKLSSLTAEQHYKCLKVLCAEYPNVLECEFIPRPTKQDHRIFEEVKPIYEKEQIEYIEWAKTLWTNGHCVRALHPKPPVEIVYEAEFKLRANKVKSFPKTYMMAAQIPLEIKKDKFEMKLQKELIGVNITELPEIKIPELISRRVTVMVPCPVPEPCNKHPCRFVLPNEKSTSILPITEIHRELAQYALHYGAHYVASEGALRCLVERYRYWSLPISVCEVIGADGETSNVVVIGSEFQLHKDMVQKRTYKGFRHLLENVLVPTSEKAKLLTRGQTDANDSSTNENDNSNEMENTYLSLDDFDDDEDEERFYIDTGEDDIDPKNGTETAEPTEQDANLESNNSDTEFKTDKAKKGNETGLYSCTCKDLFASPPPRSFNKWQLRNTTNGDNYDIIVHCSHKVRSEFGEVILEPIPEYQIDVGASEPSPDRLRSQALALRLRKKASLLNVRIDSSKGDIVTCDRVFPQDFALKWGDVTEDVTSILHTALNQLYGLLPGKYILHHEPVHGANALLYVARPVSAESAELYLDLCWSKLPDIDETKDLKTAPTLAPVLLPSHKLRKILPCAFTPNEWQMPKEKKKPAARNRTPPRALTYPKKNLRKKTK